MKTNREVVSETMHRLNALNVDELISNRMVLTTLRNSTAAVIRQRSDNRRLFQNMELFVTVNVLLEEYNGLRRSTKAFPERYDTTYAQIVRVFTIDGLTELTPTTYHEYQYKAERRFKDPAQKYFYFEGDRLVVADPNIEEVVVSGIFKEPAKARLMDKNAVTPSCMFPMDDLFVCPSELVGDVIGLTVQSLIPKREIMATQDETPDGNILRK